MARRKGVKMSFDRALAVACRDYEFWCKKGEYGAWAVWQGDKFIGAAGSEAAANNLIVRSFAVAIGAEEGGE